MGSDYRVADDAARWAHRGDEIRTLAEEASDPPVKAMMLRMAGRLERGASAEKARQRGSRSQSDSSTARSPDGTIAFGRASPRASERTRRQGKLI
jgi:hypothetical protein